MVFLFTIIDQEKAARPIEVRTGEPSKFIIVLRYETIGVVVSSSGLSTTIATHFSHVFTVRVESHHVHPKTNRITIVEIRSQAK